MTADYLLHVTNEMGHVRRSYRCEVDRGVVRRLRPVLSRAIRTGGLVDVLGTGWFLKACETPGNLAVRLQSARSPAAPGPAKKGGAEMRAIVCMLVVLVCCSFVAEDSPAEDSPAEDSPTVGRWKVRTDVITDGVRLNLTGCEPGATGKPLSLEDCGECWGALIVRCSGRGVTLAMLSHPLGFLGDEAFIDSTGEGQTSLLLVSESSVGDMTLRLDKEAVRIEPGWTFQRKRKVSKHRHKIPAYRRRIEWERDVANSSAGLPLVRRLFSGQARKLAVRAKSPFSDEVWTLLFDISESKAAAGACLKVADELYEYEELLRDVREDSIDWHLF